MTKRAAITKAPPPNYVSGVITVTSRSEAEFAGDVAKKLTRPEVHSASIIEAWQKDTHDVNELVTELARQVEVVSGGNLARAEGMLLSQAHALDNIFANLARRATTQQHLTQWEAYMRMAMKAQNQCRMTLESLAAIKNPPVVFAKQANIANGPQQVNNGPPPPSAPARTAEVELVPNEKLEDQRNGSTTLDPGTTPKATRGHSKVEAMAKGDRTKKRGG